MIFGETATNILAIATTIVGSIMALAFFPQAYRLLKRKSSEDISLILFGVMAVELALWLFYGLAIDDYPLIIVGVISTTGILTVIAATLKYRKWKK